MITLQGKGVFGGIAIGALHFYNRRKVKIKRVRTEDTEAEIARFEDAKQRAENSLKALYEKALHEVGQANAAIFEIHQMMLNDEDFCDAIRHVISSQQVNAEYAVGVTSDRFSEMFSAMEDSYMRARAADVRDVSERLLNVLQGIVHEDIASEDAMIIAADDLVPSETVQLDKNKVLAFVTRKGSANSHTAILARTMNIPAIVSTGDTLEDSFDGKLAIVDGFTGTLYLEPDEKTLSDMTARRTAELEKAELLKALKGLDNVTLDGTRIEVFTNIGNPSDLGAVLENDAGGIGLLRSEFLYLEADDYPDEETQFIAYKTVLETMAGKKAVIRTLDIGADKQADYFNLPCEENPALGFRAIRICLERREIFKTQLRALYRASSFGTLAIMFPMITSVEEVLEIKRIISEVTAELDHEKIKYSPNVEIGIMIETPAAAIISDLLAKEVDFFSVGTNDLSQYTMAIDRQNQQLETFFNPHHPAVLRLIEFAALKAHENSIWIGICGELAADLELTEWFLKIGVDELSVSPGYVLALRKRIREINLKE